MQFTDFVNAIRDEPDDDAPRLICADWLEERGDSPRAEFIRAQVERANLSDDDPRQSELLALELRLLKKHGAQWTGGHFVFKKCRFRRGFIEYVHLHLQQFLHHRREMFRLAPVRDVSLTGWSRAKDHLVQLVANCKELRHIETLRIHHQGRNKDPRSNLVTLMESPHWDRLRVFHCPCLKLTTDTRRRFEALPVLRQLEEFDLPELDRGPWSEDYSRQLDDPGEWFSDGGAKHMKQWANLRRFTLSEDASWKELDVLAAAPFWNRLVSLPVYFDSGTEPDDVARMSELLPESLRELTLCWDDGCPGELLDVLFTRLAELPLEKLLVNACLASADSLAKLFAPSSRCKLNHLGLVWSVTEDHARVIAESPKASRL
ncbi:MAG: TIGR02996 domain-containing protein, partial [Planctomycetales bacterium]